MQENSPVDDVVFDEVAGLWKITIDGSDKSYKARVKLHAIILLVIYQVCLFGYFIRATQIYLFKIVVL